jgi:hypothetical protein
MSVKTENSQENKEEIIINKEYYDKEFQDFLDEYKKLPNNEEKLTCLIDFMKKSISQEGSANFRWFWDAKKLCLDLFKEPINSVVRAKYWKEYLDLTKEALRLKDLLDEQTSFAVEQIDIAITAIEKDLENYEDLFKKMRSLDFPRNCRFLDKKKDNYDDAQKELNLLNTFAAKINSLRKELIKINMRVRFKNKFFKRLSIGGDKIFPKRKELIQEISNAFISDVEEFVEMYFSKENFGSKPHYILRDEIKGLQNFAKLLTLNTKSFTSTRLKLSKCWDQLKELEKESNSEYEEKKKISEENKKIILAKIATYDENGITSKSLTELDNLLKEMKNVELVFFDVKQLKSEIFARKEKIFDIEKTQKEEVEKIAQEKRNAKQQKIADLKSKIDSLVKDSTDASLEDFSNMFDQIKENISTLALNKIEKQMLERLLKPIKDVLAEKKEKAALDLPKDQLDQLNQLNEVLKSRLERRSVIKKEIDNYRKELGGSSLDFEKSMMLNELLDTEKNRLDKLEESIKEIEDKIEKIEQ